MKNKFINLAIREAIRGFRKNEVPVGAVVVDQNGNVVSQAHNLVESKNDPTCHAEVLAIKNAIKITGKRYLNDCSIWVTLEPCILCSALILKTRIKRLYFGAEDKKMGSVENGLKIFYSKYINHKVEVYYGFKEEIITKMMKRFFQNLRVK